MNEFIANISAARDNSGNIAVSWVWPSGYDCVRIVFTHKLGGRDVSGLRAEELSECSDLCFTDEFRTAGGKYIYPVGANDAGLLGFCVYCCEAPDRMIFEKHSGIARVTAITLNIRYKVNEKKSGKLYKKLTFRLDCDAEVPAGSLAYRLASTGAVYVIGTRVPKGSSETPPVIVTVSDKAVLMLAQGHEDEYVIQEM